MLRANIRLVSQASRRLHSTARPSLASTTHASSMAATAAASQPGSSSGEKSWMINLAIGAAASVSALGVGIAAGNIMDEKSVAKCESSHQTQTTPPSQIDDDGEDDEGDTKFRNISPKEIYAEQNSYAGKSERAFASALENSLFNTYEDGADDWEEEGEEDKSQEIGDNVAATNNNNNAVMEKFVSFSPMSSPVTIAPRMSIRGTNRKPNKEEDSGSGNNNHELLATSEGLMPTEPKEEEESEEAKAKNKEVIIKRINTIARRKAGLGQNQVYTKKMYFYQSTQVKEFMRNKFRLFALPSSENLGKEMAYLLGTDLNCLTIGSFTDGETSVKIDDAVRGKEVFVVCTTTSTSSIMELLLTISALRRGSAKRICAVLPYYGYCRQDRRTGMKREPIAAADMAHLLEEMGVDSVICCDLHNPLLKGFFSPTVPVDHLMPGPVAAAYFYEELFGTGDEDDAEEKKEEPKEVPKITIVAAHENQVFRANGFRNALQKLSGSDDIRVALLSNTKALNVHTMSNDVTLVGDVKGRKCIIVDDIISTGGTMMGAIDMVNKSGASEIYAWATHGVLHLPTNDAPEKIQEMEGLKYLLISNSVTIDRVLPDKIRKLSIAPLLAESVARALHSESISTMMTVKKGQKSDK